LAEIEQVYVNEPIRDNILICDICNDSLCLF